MYQVVRGLVIRAVDYKEADRILTVLSPELGKVTVSARGVRRKNSRLRAAGQLFAYSEMTLHERRGRYTLSEADILGQFSGLERSIEAMALACYLAEVLGGEAEADRPHQDVVRLALNALHALSAGRFARPQVKAAFELRYMALSGYRPDLTACGQCGRPIEGGGAFVPRLGQMMCPACPKPPEAAPLGGAALEAARYILDAPVGRVFSFHLPARPLAALGGMAEQYLLACMERPYRTLDFYNGLDDYPKDT